MDIPAQGLSYTRSAAPQERAAIVEALGLAALDRLEATYRINSISGGGWRLAGKMTAAVDAVLRVTLEPVPSDIDEAFNVEFWRDLDEPEGGEDKSVLDGADVEHLEGDAIPAGRIVFESLSAALDPYPRKEGATFDWKDPKAAEAGKSQSILDTCQVEGQALNVAAALRASSARIGALSGTAKALWSSPFSRQLGAGRARASRRQA